MEGAARLVSEHRFQELSQLASILEVLEHRRALLGVLRQSLSRAERLPAHRRGEPRARAALAQHRGRQLRPRPPQPRRRVGDRPGADGLPARDHRRAPGRLASCRASWPRSTTSEARPLRGARRGRDADERAVKKAFRALARELHPDVNRHDPEAEEKFKEAAEAYEILSDAERRATYDRYGFEGLESRGYASQRPRLRLVRRHLRRLLRRRPVRRRLRRRRRAACRAATWGWRSRSPSSRPRAATGRGGLRPRGRLRALPRQPRRAGHADRDLRALRRRRARARGHAHRVRPARARAGLRRLRGRGQDPDTALRGVRAAAGARRCARRSTVDVPAGIADEQRIRLTGRGHAGERGGPPGDLYVLVRVRRGRALPARRQRPRDRGRRARAGGRARRHGHAWPRSTARRSSRCRRAPSRARSSRLRGRGMPAIGRGRRGDQRVVMNVVIPRNLSRAPARAARGAARLAHGREPGRAERRVAAGEGQARLPRDPARRAGAAPRTPSGCSAALLELAPSGRGAGGRRRLGRVRALRRARASCPRSRRRGRGGRRARGGERRRGGRRLGRALARVPPAGARGRAAAGAPALEPSRARG